MNAAPGSPPIDVFIAGSSAPFATVAYGETSPYVEVDEGDVNLVARVAGTDTVLFETASIDIEDNDQITTVAAGDVTSADPATSFRLLPLFENFGDDESGEARIRLVNALPEVPSIDVDIEDNATIDVTGLQRFEATTSNGIVVPSDTALQIVVLSNGQRLTAFTTPGLPSEGEVFVIATGFVNEQPREATAFDLFAVDSAGTLAEIQQNPTVYALHASPDAPALDVRANGVLVFPDIGFSNLVPVQVPPGDYTFTFSPAGNPDVTLGSAQALGLAAGQRYLAVASGMLTPATDEARFGMTVYQDLFAIDDRPRLRAINSSPDSPIIDMSTETGGQLDTPPLFTELAFTDASAPEGQAVGSTPSLILGVAPTKTTTPFATFSVNTSGAPAEFVIAAGAVSPAPDEQSYRLLVVNTRLTPWSIGTSFPL